MRFSRARTSPAMRAEARSESVTIGAGYFWFYAGVGAFIPYTAIYYRSLGFTGVELGLLTALPALGTALTGPIWGIVADTFSVHRQMMQGVLAMAAVVSVILARITNFAPFMVALALLAIVIVPVPSLLDSYAVSAVERGGAPYGVLRIFGSLGFTAMVLVMGRIMSGELSPIFLYAYAACHLVTAAVAFRLPQLGERVRRPLLAGIRLVFRSHSYLLLLLVAFLISAGYATLSIYLALHVESLGGSTSIVGTAFAISAMSELPIIGFGALILQRLGARRVIIIALIVYLIRFSLLGFTHATASVLVAQALHGLSFGMFLIASVTLAHRLVGREHAATAQALLAMMSVGLGNIVGSFVGGVVIGETSTATLYQGVTLLMAIALATFVTGSRMIGRNAYDPAETA